MTNNVGVTRRLAQPTYLDNSALGAVNNGITGMFGGAANMNRMLGGVSPASPSPAGRNARDLMNAVQGGLGGVMRTQPVGPAIPVQSPTMSTMPVGRPMPLGDTMNMPQQAVVPNAPVNVRNANMPAVTGAPARRPAPTITKGGSGGPGGVPRPAFSGGAVGRGTFDQRIRVGAANRGMFGQGRYR